MPEKEGPVGRRDFLRKASAAGLSIGLAKSALAARGAKTSGRVVGSNDRINVGVIGVGGRGSSRPGGDRYVDRGVARRQEVDRFVASGFEQPFARRVVGLR